MTLQSALTSVLLLLGVGFLVANVRVALDLVRFVRRRSSALLVWLPPRPPFYGLLLAIGVMLGALILVNSAFRRSTHAEIFGEGMMFVYYASAVPLSRRICRGFYADGIWAESGFVHYDQIDAVSWREGEQVTLLLVSRLRSFARRLTVPSEMYGAARRLLRDKIKAHDIHFSGTSLGLGTHDARDDI
jgi:hypothetical protein